MTTMDSVYNLRENYQTHNQATNNPLPRQQQLPHNLNNQTNRLNTHYSNFPQPPIQLHQNLNHQNQNLNGIPATASRHNTIIDKPQQVYSNHLNAFQNNQHQYHHSSHNIQLQQQNFPQQNFQTHTTYSNVPVHQSQYQNQQHQVPLLYHPTPIGLEPIPTIPVQANLRPVESIQHIDDCDAPTYSEFDLTDNRDSHQIIQAILIAKEALEKPIEERDDRDINLIDNLCSSVRGFNIFPRTIRRALAEHAVLAVIDETGKELIVHNEVLDSYCVLIHGLCEQLDVTKTKTTRIYNVGDAFGVCDLTTDVIKFEGFMRTLWENCAFLCVKRDDFYAILTDPANFPNKETICHRDKSGNIYCISQLDVLRKSSSSAWSYNIQADGPFRLNLPDGHIISKASEECLLMALVNGYDKVDPEYVEDFLILFRVFLSLDQLDKDKGLPPGMTKLCSCLTSWLDYEPYQDRVIKIVLTWLSSYYQDFELNCDFSYIFFRELESKLIQLSMNDQLQLLHVTLSTKSKIRNVTISKSSREQPLPFLIAGGSEQNCGIYVTQVYSNIPSDNFNNRMQPRPRYIGGQNAHRQTIPGPMHDHRYTESLRPGDQILEVNGTNFTSIRLTEAQKKLDVSTHLSLTVKYNPSSFYEMQIYPDGRRKPSSVCLASGVPSSSPHHSVHNKFTFNAQDLQSAKNNPDTNHPPPSPLFSMNSNLGFASLIKPSSKFEKNGGDSKFKFSNLISSSKNIVKHIRDTALTQTIGLDAQSKNQDQMSESSSISNGMENLAISKTRSNPDLSNVRPKIHDVAIIESQFESSINTEQVLGPSASNLSVLKVFNSQNNEFRHIFVNEETTARDAILIALREFGLPPSSSNMTHDNVQLDWLMYEVSVVPETRTIKQRCLSEQTTKLSDRIPLSSRYYIKNLKNTCGPTKLDTGDDSLVSEILKESPLVTTLTSLNATLLAVELTLLDFDKFKFIEPQQFVYDTFFDYSDKHKKPSCGNSIETSSLKSSSSENQDLDPLSCLNKTRTIPRDWMVEYQEFADVSNKEMFWVACEILSEKNIAKRVKIVKQFIRVADVCLQLRNYNSMFAIISGLGHSCISRLRRTFEKLKPKYKNQLEKMRTLFDPSRNMANYRLCLSQTPPPAIPLFPQIKKDLTFSKEGRTIFVRKSNDATGRDEDDDDLENDTADNNHNGSGHNPRTHPNTLVPKPRTNANIQSFKTSNSKTGGDSILINFAEIRQFTERIGNVTYFSSVPYSNDLLSNTKDAQKNQAQARKMYEEWQMRKRIRYYIVEILDKPAGNLDQPDSSSALANGKVTIIYDEKALHVKSLEVEPDLNNQNLNRPQSSVTDKVQHQQHQHQQQQQQQVPQASHSSGSPSLSESSSLQSLPFLGSQHLSDSRQVSDMKRNFGLTNKVRGLDRFMYDSISDTHSQNSNNGLVVDQQQTLQSQATNNTAQLAPMHLRNASHLAAFYHQNQQQHGHRGGGKFGTENVENIRKLQALSEARHRAKPLN